jgi:hypothetical protein
MVKTFFGRNLAFPSGLSQNVFLPWPEEEVDP